MKAQSKRLFGILFCGSVLLISCSNPSSSLGDGPLMANPPSLSGTWNWGETVTDASIVCSDEVGDSDVVVVTITQNGSVLTMTGLIGVPTDTLRGDIYPPQGTELARVKLYGKWPEDGGTTTVMEGSWIKVITANLMQGSEVWHWEGVGGTCTGQTRITAAK